MASNPDMSDRQKLKVIQQALKKGSTADKPVKSYVVAKKFQGGKPTTSVSVLSAKSLAVASFSNSLGSVRISRSSPTSSPKSSRAASPPHP
jgi:hypothetical protein